MKLQILITQYTEDENILCEMLTSIGTQQGVDLKNDIEVLIGNDGSDVKLSEEFLGSFSFPIRYLHFEHSGIAGCRQNLLNTADAEYVMFCDADDMFLSNIGINTIFRYMEQGFDAFTSEFCEEVLDRKTGRRVYAMRKNDRVFVHGKVYRRQFLLDNGIVWHPEIPCHEDSCFNILARERAGKFVYCPMPFYLWHWRDDSVCRKDPYFRMKTYPFMLASNELLVRDFLMRKDIRNAALWANYQVYSLYYDLNRDVWWQLESTKYRYETEKRFKEYYLRHKPLINAISEEDRRKLILGVRRGADEHGFVMERFTFQNWIRHIETL